MSLVKKGAALTKFHAIRMADHQAAMPIITSQRKKLFAPQTGSPGLLSRRASSGSNRPVPGCTEMMWFLHALVCG